MERQSRRHTILQLIVESYIQNAQPVSSTMVATACPAVNLSSASLRAVMAQLERDGLLTQPHTSSGRIPTERGLRAYLDNLVAHRLRPWDRTRLEATTIDPTGGSADTFVTRLGQTLSALAGQMAVVAVPQFAGERLRELGLVRLDACRVLAYFVSPHGHVQQKLVCLDFDPTNEDLSQLQNYLNAHLGKSSLAEVRATLQTELHNAQVAHDRLRARTARLGQSVLPKPSFRVVVEGALQLLSQPEFADVTTLRAVLETIEQKQRVLHLLDGLLEKGGVQVMLGSEHARKDLHKMACVGCTRRDGAGARATISLWGPSRMDYGRLMPLVGYAANLLGRFYDYV